MLLITLLPNIKYFAINITKYSQFYIEKLKSTDEESKNQEIEKIFHTNG